jgi:hypothetical protein
MTGVFRRDGVLRRFVRRMLCLGVLCVSVRGVRMCRARR